MSDEVSSYWTAEARASYRSWGLAAIKSAYGETYPVCQAHTVAEIAKRIEENMFRKAATPEIYKHALIKALNSIRVLAMSKARNSSKKGVPANAVTRGTSNVSQNASTTKVTGTNLGCSQVKTECPRIPDPSDVIQLVPYILEAGVNVLGKIETIQQVRALNDGKKSTVGFLAFEMLSKLSAPTKRTSGTLSASGHRSLEKRNIPAFKGPLNCAINAVPSVNVPPRTLTVKSGSSCPSLNGAPVSINTREACGSESSNNNHVGILGCKKAMQKETQSTPSITFAGLKAEYGETIRKLAPLIETMLGEETNEQGKDPVLLLDRTHLAFVRAALTQNNITNLETIRNLKTSILNLIRTYSFLLNDTEISDSDYSEELGETDSETEEESEAEQNVLEALYEQGFIFPEGEDSEQQANFFDKDEDEYADEYKDADEDADEYGDEYKDADEDADEYGDEYKDADEYGDEYKDVDEDADEDADEYKDGDKDGDEDEDKQEEHDLDRSEINEDIIRSHEIGEIKADEILPRDQQAHDTLPGNHQAFNRTREEPGSNSTIIEELEELCKTIDKQEVETQESILATYRENNTKEVPSFEQKGLRQGIAKSKIAEERKDINDPPVPTFTPRRSMRIRNQAFASDTQESLSGTNTATSVVAAPKKNETPAKTQRTRKTPRKTARKTPRK